MDETAVIDIGQIQRSDSFQRYLKASSYLYSKAKLINGFQAILTVIVPVILSTLAILLSPQYSGFKVWAAFYGIFISGVDIAVFDKTQKDLKKEAAKIQECFDCDLLMISWNYFKVGDRPAPEKIDQSARAFKKDLSESQQNWYPAKAGNLPLYLCRVICQRANIWWDGELRRKYRQYLTVFAVALVVTGVVVGLAKSMSMELFLLSIMAPIYPAVVWLMKEIKKQKESTETLDRLMKHAITLWKDALGATANITEVATRSRELQDEIFVHRYSNQPVPNWINKLIGRDFDTSMNKGAEELIAQAKAVLKDSVDPNFMAKVPQER